MNTGKSQAIFISRLFLFALCAHNTETARILGFFSTPSKSHTLIHAAIADTLASAGHNVTVVAVSENVYPNAKYEFIKIDLEAGAQFDRATLTKWVNRPQPFYLRAFNLVSSFIDTGNRTLSHPKMREFLRAHGEGAFDLILLGYTFNDYAMGLGAHFRCPIVASFMVQPLFALDRLVANPAEHAYAPMMLSNLRAPLNFWGRVQNYLGNLLEQWIMLPTFERDWQRVYK